MHIIQVAPRFPPAIGGVEEHVYQISVELLKRGHKITVVTSDEVDGKTRRRNNEFRQRMRVYRLPLFMPKVLREFWFTTDILNMARQLDGDVVHAHGYRCLISDTAVCLAHIAHLPVVFTPHGIYPPQSMEDALMKTAFDHTLGRLTLDFSDRIIALSKHNINLLLDLGASANKIRIVPNGINIEDYENLKQGPRKRHTVDSDGPILLYVGRIDWNKRLEKVVEAMPPILKDFPSARTVLVGPDYAGHTRELWRLAKKLGVDHALVITGSVSKKDLLNFYSVADVFILPSSYEGFGLSMLEAMGSKIPVIVSPTGGPGDILRHNLHAWLLQDVSPTEISHAVHTLVTDNRLRDSLVKNAFALVKSKYTWKRVVDALELIYEEVARSDACKK